MEYEKVFRLIQNERWFDASDLIHKGKEEMSENPLNQQAAQTFESELFRKIRGSTSISEYVDILDRVVQLHSGKIYTLNNENIELALKELINLKLEAGKTIEAYSLARILPENPFCIEILERSEESQSVFVDHSKSEKIELQQVSYDDTVDHRISLFKSDLERVFFLALRETLQSYVVYPNVALSTLVNFDAIKSKLSKEEKNYFFNGVVDCVVFDQQQQYLPIYFFELDSSYHDKSKQRQRDEYKNRILSVAGQQLIRIRPRGQRLDQRDFGELIREALDGNA